MTERVHARTQPLDRKALDPERREIRARLTEEVVDSFGEVVRAAGVQWDRFRVNPKMLWHHQGEEDIGTWEPATLRRETVRGVDGWTCVGRLYPAGTSPRADEVHRKLQAGTMGVSIGFGKDVTVGPPMLKGQTGATLEAIHVHEASLVNLPACPTCMVLEKSAEGAGACRCHDDVDLTPADIRAALREVLEEQVARAIAHHTGRVYDEPVLVLDDERSAEEVDVSAEDFRAVWREIVAERAEQVVLRLTGRVD